MDLIGKFYSPDSMVSHVTLIVPDILLPLKCDQENPCVEMSSVFFLETVVEIPTSSAELNDIIFMSTEFTLSFLFCCKVKSFAS